MYTTNDTLSQEVANFDKRAFLADGSVDGKVSIYKSHLVLEALDDALDQILDVRADGTHSSYLLLGAEPLLDLDLLGVQFGDVNAGVLEATAENTTWALDCDNSGFDKHLD